MVMDVKPVAGYDHDHLFAPNNHAEDTMEALARLAQTDYSWGQSPKFITYVRTKCGISWPRILPTNRAGPKTFHIGGTQNKRRKDRSRPLCTSGLGGLFGVCLNMLLKPNIWPATYTKLSVSLIRDVPPLRRSVPKPPAQRVGPIALDCAPVPYPTKPGHS